MSNERTRKREREGESEWELRYCESASESIRKSGRKRKRRKERMHERMRERTRTLSLLRDEKKWSSVDDSFGLRHEISQSVNHIRIYIRTGELEPV